MGPGGEASFVAVWHNIEINLIYLLQSCVPTKQERLSLWMNQTAITFVLFVKIYSLSHFSLNADISFVADVMIDYFALTKPNAPLVVIPMHSTMLISISF